MLAVGVALDSAGVPLVAVVDAQLASRVSVYKFGNSFTGWRRVGDAGFGQPAQTSVCLRLDSKDAPHVAVNQAVWRLAADSWQQLGPLFAAAPTSGVSLALDGVRVADGGENVAACIQAHAPIPALPGRLRRLAAA